MKHEENERSKDHDQEEGAAFEPGDFRGSTSSVRFQFRSSGIFAFWFEIYGLPQKKTNLGCLKANTQRVFE